MVSLARQSRRLSALFILQLMGLSGMKAIAYSHASSNILCAQATKEMERAFLWA